MESEEIRLLNEKLSSMKTELDRIKKELSDSKKRSLVRFQYTAQLISTLCVMSDITVNDFVTVYLDKVSEDYRKKLTKALASL